MIAIAAVLLTQAATAHSAPAHPHDAPSFEILSRQAAEARDGKRPADALILFRKALQLKPDWAEGLWAVGSIEYDQDQYKECSADFRRLAALKPDESPGLTMAGLCEYHLRDYNAALKSLLQAQQSGFQQGAELARAGRLHLALVLIKLGKFENAITTLVKLTRDDNKKTAEIIVASGIAGLREPWTPPEVPESERDKVFKLGDAMAAVMEQDSKLALEKFNAVVRDYPKDANVHFRYGAFLMQEDPERGIQEIVKTLELQPDHLPALVSLANIYLKRDQASAARQYAEKAVRLAPGDFATHVTLGRVLRESDDDAGAVREFEAAVRLAPASPDSHFELATGYAKLGRIADAAREREEFRRLRKVTDPNQP
jgi:tetratricopeptide (TPR) repeat protein